MNVRLKGQPSGSPLATEPNVPRALLKNINGLVNIAKRNQKEFSGDSSDRPSGWRDMPNPGCFR